MAYSSSLSMFLGFGIEIEYMIVNRKSLNICPIADSLLYDSKDGYRTEIMSDGLGYSNELALHLIELKTDGPCEDLQTLPALFNSHIRKLNSKLAKDNAMLLPTGIHPWMEPHDDFKMWPHKYNDIYTAYDTIFDCRNHGWCNVQSTHLNLPFANDEEFARLHTAVRLLLPIIPALTASSPIVDLEPTGYMDARLFFYAQNQRKIPAITGKVIPEIITSKEQYEREILQKMYRAIEPYDKNGVLRHEWLNSRGAIARFDRNTIEIRIMDTQESPLADLSIMALIIATLQNIVSEKWLQYSDQIKLKTLQLRDIYQGIIKYGSDFKISDRGYLQAFGYNDVFCSAQQLWRHIFNVICESQFTVDQQLFTAVEMILAHGNLSERILFVLGGDFSRKNVLKVYTKLANCLENNMIFNEKLYEKY